ncbi:MAG: peptidoglycan-binding protein [Bryobacterales bacterium]|nr:peptidoglycan-binding protein [Bryobacterales bacterium]
MPKIIASQGDSIPSIATDNGFFWETIWNHPENAQLKARRKSPNQLLPGDEVFVPELRIKSVSKGTDARHKFKRKGVPAKLRLQLKLLGEPRANESYVLEIDSDTYKGTTDGNGILEQFIAPNAKGGRLLLNGGKEVIPIRLGHLNPVEDISGVQQRLNNLGFNCGSEDGELDDQTRAAVRAFQEANGLQPTGEPDGPVKAKLSELHP